MFGGKFKPWMAVLALVALIMFFTFFKQSGYDVQSAPGAALSPGPDDSTFIATLEPDATATLAPSVAAGPAAQSFMCTSVSSAPSSSMW